MNKNDELEKNKRWTEFWLKKRWEVKENSCHCMVDWYCPSCKEKMK